jgi:hypothetical protein
MGDEGNIPMSEEKREKARASRAVKQVQKELRQLNDTGKFTITLCLLHNVLCYVMQISSALMLISGIDLTTAPL